MPPKGVSAGNKGGGVAHECILDLRKLKDSSGIGAEALSTRCWQATGFNGLVIAYPAWTPAEIEAAVAGIGQTLAQMPAPGPGRDGPKGAEAPSRS